MTDSIETTEDEALPWVPPVDADDVHAITYKLPPLPKNLPNVVRRIRACEGDVAAQVVFEHALNKYAIAAIEAQASVVPQEPVAWVDPGDFDLMQSQGRGVIAWPKQYPNATMPLYTHPAQQAKPQPLTNDQKLDMWTAATIEQPSARGCYFRGVEDAEAAHGIQGSAA